MLMGAKMIDKLLNETLIDLKTDVEIDVIFDSIAEKFKGVNFEKITRERMYFFVSNIGIDRILFNIRVAETTTRNPVTAIDLIIEWIEDDISGFDL